MSKPCEGMGEFDDGSLQKRRRLQNETTGKLRDSHNGCMTRVQVSISTVDIDLEEHRLEEHRKPIPSKPYVNLSVTCCH